MASPLVFDRLGGVGISVSDLKRSVDFYIRVCGMKQLMNFKLPQMDEVFLGFSGAQFALVLMHWTDGSGPNVQDLPIKVILYVADPAGLAAAIRAEGYEVIREPAPVPELGGVIVGFAKDPDGYIIEILQSNTPG
jgi:lactoylglutathione lyase